MLRIGEVSMKVLETKDGLILDVYVKPKSKFSKIAVEGNELVIYCSEEPVDGKVNREIVKMLSKVFHQKVMLVAGFASKQKRLLVKDMTKNEADRILSRK